MRGILAEKREQNNRRKTFPAQALLAWYDDNRRVLPWRALPGQGQNPYRVWLSEVMLQQTTVAAVIPYFLKFTRRWPTVAALARADLDEVLIAWAGLGYYSRARNLHKTAQAVMEAQDGVFPADEDALRALPGIGEYTAAAIRAIAFGQRANVVDGNVERVMARFFAVEEPLPQAKPTLKTLAAKCVPPARGGDYAQALMDLGAGICVPRGARCGICPLAKACAALKKGLVERLPARSPKAKKPVRKAFAFVAFDRAGRVFLEKRPPSGLLGGMCAPPTTPLDAPKPLAWRDALRYAPKAEAPWRVLDEVVHHVFTHFTLELRVAVLSVAQKEIRVKGIWIARRSWGEQALPSVMRKALECAARGMDTEKRKA